MLFNSLKKVLNRNRRNEIGSLNSTTENIMNQLALIGGQLFGSSDKERLFYIRDQKTVVWKEGDITTYYQMTDNGVIKTQDGQKSQKVSDIEARRLLKAVYAYGSFALSYLNDLPAKG